MAKAYNLNLIVIWSTKAIAAHNDINDDEYAVIAHSSAINN